MPQENVETLRRLFERWNTGERGVPAEDLDPARELESPFASTIGEPYRGPDGIAQWMRDLDENFVEWRLALDEVREVGNTVVGIGTSRLRGRTSGVAFDQPTAWVVEFGADHRITRARI